MILAKIFNDPHKASLGTIVTIAFKMMIIRGIRAGWASNTLTLNHILPKPGNCPPWAPISYDPEFIFRTKNSTI